MGGKPAARESWLCSRSSSHAVCVTGPSWRPATGTAAEPCLPASPCRRARTRGGPLGFRLGLAVGFAKQCWAGRRHATQGHDFLRGHRLGGHARPQPGGAGDAGTDRAILRSTPPRPAPPSFISMCAIPRPPSPSMDGALYREVVERIRASGTDVLINLTTGPGARFVHERRRPVESRARHRRSSGPDERVRHVVELKPDICSLDMGSLNMGSARLHQHARATCSHGDRDPRCRRACRNSKCSRPATCCSPSA